MNTGVKKENQFTREVQGTAPTGGEAIRYSDTEEAPALAELQSRNDFEAIRLKRLFALPDLSRKENSPIKYIIDRILSLRVLKDFDLLTIPESITVSNNFDLFDFPLDHPARRETDTYFLNPSRTLRTHTTSMWLYYLTDSLNIEKLTKRGWVGLTAYGKVYRKDEIDRKHMPIFHQVDGLYICDRKKKIMTLEDLHDVLTQVVKGVFGDTVEYRFLEDKFPYTDPSTQIEVKFGDEWLELLGAGIPLGSTLKKLGLDPEVYTGWAFGFGVERLAMRKMDIPDIRILWSEDPRITSQFASIDSKYKEVSRYPEIIRDISFVVPKDVVPNRFYEIVREVGGDLVEDVKMIDEYENEVKLGAGKKSYAFRTLYRSFERTLTNDEVQKLHNKVEDLVRSELGAVVR